MICESCLLLLKENKLLKEQNSFLKQENQQLKKRIEILEQQVKEIKSYIWKPKIQTVKPLKLGPPENHEPNNRPIPKHIDETKSLSLKRCPECNSKLSKPFRVRKRYVEDITQPEPLNTEYNVPYYWCSKCNKQVSPKPADVIPKCRFGIRLMLLATFMRYGLSLPYNKISTLLETCYGISITEGCLVDSITRFAEHLGPEFEQIKEDIRKAASTCIDTTSWRINGQNKVLWDFISEKCMLLMVRDTKAQGIVYQTLGNDYKGISITDCAREYDCLGWKQQKCWVHLLRASRKLETGGGKRLHVMLKTLHSLAVKEAVPVDALLKQLDRICSIRFTDKKCAMLVKRMVKYRNEWFTFVGNKHVSDNNNAAERGLRPSVVMRKITGGNRSHRGARNHEVIMSVMQTWDKQGRDFFEEAHKIVQDNLP